MNISHIYTSDHLQNSDIDIVVTIPTFRRPEQLINTLKSLEQQTIQAPMAAIIMDNDDAGDGAKAARAFFKTSKLQGMVIIAHDRGNCHAYNAGWATALEEFRNFRWLAVIDDDEIASQNWLLELTAAALDTHADLVGGPQVAQFPKNAPRYITQHPVFKPHYDQSGAVDILYSSGNVLIARKVLEHMPAPFLNPLFNFTGGGDSDFYQRCKGAGFSFAWCQDAPVFEPVPKQRATFRWVHARSLRNGALSSLIEKRTHNNRFKTIMKTLALCAAAPLRAIALMVKTRSLIAGLYHIQIALGRLLQEAGIINEQYRNPEAN